MMGLSRLRRRWRQYQVWRRYLSEASNSLVEIRGFGYGFTPILMALRRLERDGWIITTEQGVRWRRRPRHD